MHDALGMHGLVTVIDPTSPNASINPTTTYVAPNNGNPASSSQSTKSIKYATLAEMVDRS